MTYTVQDIKINMLDIDMILGQGHRDLILTYDTAISYTYEAKIKI